MSLEVLLKLLAYFTDKTSDKTSKKPYDPAQFTEKTNSPSAVQLQERIKLLEMDYRALHDKRLQDVIEKKKYLFKIKN